MRRKGDDFKNRRASIVPQRHVLGVLEQTAELVQSGCIRDHDIRRVERALRRVEVTA